VNITQILRQQALERGDAPAIIDVRGGRDRVTSFRELEAASARFAERISRAGIGTGDSALILYPMSAELYAFLIALFRVGAVAMFLDPSAGSEFIARCLRENPPKAFFGSAKAQLLRLRIREFRRVGLFICTVPLPGTLHLSLSAHCQESTVSDATEDSDPAIITFTSGSTGAPKGALRTHGFLLAQHRALKCSLGHRTGTLDLTTLPVFVLANLASGITSVIPDADMRRPGRIAPWPVIRQLQRFPISTMAASPAFVSRLTAECQRRGVRTPGMQRVYMGGAPVFPEDLREVRAAFPEAEIVAIYGSTEAEPIAEVSLSSMADDDFEAMARGRGLLAGLPVESIALRILPDRWGAPIAPLTGDHFQALCLAPEEIGEIVVSGDHVLKGYLHGIGDAENKFSVEGNIWHRTGDLGRLDRQGRLWLMGRASAVIRDERGTLYPFAVESAARQIPGIRRAAIIKLNGRRIMAVEAESRDAGEAARPRMTWTNVDEIRIVRRMPTDNRHNAKIDYAELKRILSGGR
jgi:acyl-CoA synthetase (AMP-forming)/AMP-acid ligase II